jgi:hypothetical protein
MDCRRGSCLARHVSCEDHSEAEEVQFVPACQSAFKFWTPNDNPHHASASGAARQRSWGTGDDDARRQMTSLADLAAKTSASKKKRDARTAAISQRVDDLDKRADTLLSQSETVNDDKDHELEELDASLNPDIGYNGSPDRGRSGA